MVHSTIIAAADGEVISRTSPDRLIAQFVAGIGSLIVISGTGYNNLQSTSQCLSAMQAALGVRQVDSVTRLDLMMPQLPAAPNRAARAQ